MDLRLGSKDELGWTWGLCEHVCRDMRLFIQVSEVICDNAEEMAVPLACVRPGKINSLNMTCLEIYSLRVTGSRHKYPLELVGYPRKTQGVVLGCNLCAL